MAELVIRAEARVDMLDIYARGVEEFGTATAKKYMQGMDSALSRLSEFPLIGPIYPGLRIPVRYLAFRSHHIFYDFDGSTVWIVRILHHALDAGRFV